MELNKSRHGAFLTGNRSCFFSVWAPERQSVELITLNPDKKIVELKSSNSGYWTIHLDNIEAGTRYLYRLDGKEDRPDIASMSQPGGVHEASEIYDRDKFQWTDKNWKGIELGDMIQYELHTGTYTPEGTLDAIVQKLPYLVSLGINTIELMPVAEFPGKRNWGYDGVYPNAVQSSYGGPDALKTLVNAAHQHGIAVILDVVYNHLGPEGNYFNDYGPYFTDKYKTPWGKAINFDDANCDGVREYYLQNAMMWLVEFHIDGLRLDAVHAIWDSGAHHLMEELNLRVREFEASSGRKKVLIAEFDLNNPRYINPPNIGGYGLDGQWVDEFHHALHSVVTGETDGYYEDFGSAELIRKAYRDAYVYTGEYSKHRKKLFGARPDNKYSQFVIFSQNHDQVGNRMMGDRLSCGVSTDQLKMVAAAVLLAPQVPMLFMGEEYGEKNPFQYFVSHGDPELVEMVRKGRKEEFAYFNWKGEVPDPQSETTFQHSKLSWAVENEHAAIELFNFYQYLISLRKKHPALQGRHRDQLQIIDMKTDSIIAFRRNNADSSLVIVINLAEETSLDADMLRGTTRIFDSSKRDYSSTEVIHIHETTFAKHSVSIFEISL